MMMCESAQELLDEYLEDLLTEVQRQEVREHLSACLRCQHRLLQINTFATDLQLLLPKPIEIHLGSQVYEHLLALKKKHVRKHFILWKLTPVLVLIFAGAFGLASLIYHLKLMRIENRKQQVQDTASNQILKELKSIDERLAMPHFSTQDARKTSESMVEHLHPVVLYGIVPSTEQRSQMFSTVKSLASQVLFDSSGILIWKLNVSDFAQMKSRINTSSDIYFYRGFGLPEEFPVKQGEVEIAWILKTEDDSKDEVQVFELEFLLHNAFSLQKKLRETSTSVKFLHASEVIWVLEWSSDVTETVRELLRVFPGLMIDDKLASQHSRVMKASVKKVFLIKS